MVLVDHTLLSVSLLCCLLAIYRPRCSFVISVSGSLSILLTRSHPDSLPCIWYLGPCPCCCNHKSPFVLTQHRQGFHPRKTRCPLQLCHGYFPTEAKGHLGVGTRAVTGRYQSLIRRPPVRVLSTHEHARARCSFIDPWTRLRVASGDVLSRALQSALRSWTSVITMLTSLRLTSSLLLLLPSSLVAREIVFPPVAPLQANNGHGQYRSSVNDEKQAFLDLDRFAGLTTFSNLPWVHCLSEETDIEKYDIAFLGAPFDTATTGRPGTRYGPTGIRL